MEYYIQASDKANNISMRGFTNPLTVTVVAQLPPDNGLLSFGTGEDNGTSGSTMKKPWYKKWWVWGIALAVIGGVAAGAGGGGGGSSNNSRAGNNTTGTGTVSGPIP